MSNVLEFRWTVSRGRDTYGYNICSAWYNDRKLASCNGGNYDMKGTSFGNFLMRCFPKRLIALAEANRDKLPLIAEKSGYKNVGTAKDTPHDFYGMTVYVKSAEDQTITHVVLDGGCGFNCIERIAKDIGIRMQFIPTRKRDNSLYIVHDDRDDSETDCR